MNLSGILVEAKPQWLDEVESQLNSLDGVEVHYRDDSSGRLIAIQEAADIHAEVDGLKRIKQIRHVMLAEMVYHYIGEDEKIYEAPPELQQDGNESCGIPGYLQE